MLGGGIYNKRDFFISGAELLYLSEFLYPCAAAVAAACAECVRARSSIGTAPDTNSRHSQKCRALPVHSAVGTQYVTFCGYGPGDSQTAPPHGMDALWDKPETRGTAPRAGSGIAALAPRVIREKASKQPRSGAIQLAQEGRQIPVRRGGFAWDCARSTHSATPCGRQRETRDENRERKQRRLQLSARSMGTREV